MPSPARLLALPGNDLQNVRFALAFAAPGFADPVPPASASIEFGDGQRAPLGQLEAPPDATWREQRLLALTSHMYAGTGPYTARLLWDSLLLQVQVQPGSWAGAGQASNAPQLSLFAVEGREGRVMERSVRFQASGVPEGGMFRLDGGAGQALTLRGEASAKQPCEQRFAYAKSGVYIVALDLLDAEGFHVATCAEQTLEMGEVDDDKPADAAERHATHAASDGSPGATARASAKAGRPGRSEAPPWLPCRYVRPVWGWLRTYTSPGGSNVARVLASGTYLSVHGETSVGNEMWYQTASRDWIPAPVVEPIRPSELHGIDLAGAGESPAERGGERPGLVLPGRLNVRANPGIRADNPPTRQLQAGAAVSVKSQAYCGESLWYQIEPEGWVHAAGLRILVDKEAGREFGRLPAGWVLAPSLTVWSQPGSAEEAFEVGCLTKDTVVSILEARVLGSGAWYRVGDDRWVDGAWIAVARSLDRPARVGPGDRWLAVSLAGQTAVAYEGDRPVYAALVATGLPGTPTPAGLFRKTRRAASGRVYGGNPAWGSNYDLEDVPWITYFFGGYALVGTYWHTGFGRARSHGCVNASPYDAWWIYHWGQDNMFVYIY